MVYAAHCAGGGPLCVPLGVSAIVRSPGTKAAQARPTTAFAAGVACVAIRNTQSHCFIVFLSLCIMTNRDQLEFDSNQISRSRSDVLIQQERLFANALRGLKCDETPRWWQPPLTNEQEASCRWYREQTKRLARLEWTYYINCYDGPGPDCSQEIPKLEKKYGAWVDALALSQQTPDCNSKEEK